GNGPGGASGPFLYSGTVFTPTAGERPLCVVALVLVFRVARSLGCFGGGALASRLLLLLAFALSFTILVHHRKAHVEVTAHDLVQLFDLTFEEMVGAANDLVIDLDAALRLELCRKLGNGRRRHDAILVAVDHEARRLTGRQEREIIEIRRRRDANESVDLGPA